ncbi:hypothetical protein [Marinitoga litoralis]|uniref:hypothetical protein n=1 Tax=Marinitoga litoralis TaxID=570855 RepID=UPI0019603FDE|nr:hypothetical protein [Marinitoga litoralis]MBM7560250.1 putative RNA-binding Zn-ribbon protein involved in translation (DUF1610 family) [Marinitoga litoralis]
MSLTSGVRLPETILFMGAGFSKNAGGLSTADLSYKLKKYVEKTPDFLEDAIRNERIANIIDFEGVKEISEVIRGDNSLFLPNLFTLIDYNLEKRKGLKVKDKFFDVDRLYRIKKTVEFLIQAAEYEGFKEGIKKFERYREFCRCLQKFMIDEHYEKIIKYSPEEPEYYMSSLGVVTTNWDGIVFWEMMKLNNEFNHKSTDVGLYLDFGDLIIKKNDKFIISMDEGAVRRNNKINKKPYRIMKYIATHGMFGTRVCPNCGLYFADFGNFKNEHYEMLNTKNLDLKCPNCGTETSIIDSPLYYQSYVERKFGYLIYKWEEESINILRKAKRIIFIGYSLPDDDLQIRSMLFNVFSDGEDRKAYVMDYSDKNKSNRWYGADEAREKFEDKKDLINKYISIFGEENVMFNFSGGINAFLAGESISCEMVNEVLRGEI